MMYSEAEIERVDPSLEKEEHSELEEYRSPFRRDYARLVHSPSFRRLQGKTQLFPTTENDFFRNRLTHSIEVAQIAKDIALRINKREFIDNQITNTSEHIDLDLVEFASLAHDLGHPPFGHQGEEALDECMVEYGGFEGNAQTLRLLSKLEKKVFIESPDPPKPLKTSMKDPRVGLNLTLRTLASILKYDQWIPFDKKERQKYADELLNNSKEYDSDIRPVKGYYLSEIDLVNRIRRATLQDKIYPGFEKLKTIECSIMDISDDIAYSTYDLEDGLKAGFYSPLDFITVDKKLLERIAKKVSKKTKIPNLKSVDIQDQLVKIFKKLFDGNIIPEREKEIQDAVIASYKNSKKICSNGYHRTRTTSKLVGECIRNIKYTPGPIPALSQVVFTEDMLLQVEILKRFTYEYQVNSPRLKIAEFRGKEIVKCVFEALVKRDKDGKFLNHDFLPKDYRELFDDFEEEHVRMRVICDFVAGMTDNHLLEFYGRLFSENPESIFKPIG